MIMRYPYYCFNKKNDHHQSLEGRFWNDGGNHIAIVAMVTTYDDKGDWAAYIGTDAPHSRTEEATLQDVAEHGCKLSEEDARHFFPEIVLPYRR